jgi:hypothetical protein
VHLRSVCQFRDSFLVVEYKIQLVNWKIQSQEGKSNKNILQFILESENYLEINAPFFRIIFALRKHQNYTSIAKRSN